MARIQEYNVFIASPGDVPEERAAARDVCRQLNEDPLIRKGNAAFRAVGWEEAFPEAGRPQEIINRLVRDCDLFVCLFHKRLGTPSGKEESGTLEEFLLAYDSWRELKKPHIMLYFKDVQIKSPAEFNDLQLKKVFDLRGRVEGERLLLFDTFSETKDFRTKLTQHIKSWLAQKRTKKAAPKLRPKEVSLEIPARYRTWIADRCRYMDIDKLREKSDVIMVELPEIFVPLYANPPEKAETKRRAKQPAGPEERSEPQDLEELAAAYDRLLIEGPPGSGKTTLIKHMAYTMIHGGCPAALDGLLPVLVFLKDLKDFAAKASPKRSANGAAAEIILDYYFAKTQNGLDVERVRAFCQAGKALLLLDGLDEIDAGLRETVANAFADFGASSLRPKILLTGRPHGMDDAVVRRFGDRHVRILPLALAQREEFITKWFRYVHSPGSEAGERTAQAMIGEIRTHPGVEKLIDNPLMLTAVCILYHDGRELPGQRAELYRKIVTNLLFRRFREESERVHAFLNNLSLSMFTEGSRGIDRQPAIEILCREYSRKDDESPETYRRRIAAIFDEVEPNCGLLTLQDGQYNFRHLTLQEFLAATAIVDRETDYARAIAPHWEEERYGELIQLYVGYLSIENKRWANRIVAETLQGPDSAPFRRWRLAARALLDMHRDRREPDVARLAVEKLESIIASDAGPKERADAGETLGWLGDQRDLERFVSVPNGNYGTSQGKIAVKGLEMGACPVTNRWFAKFVKNGYSEPRFWSEQGQHWLKYTSARHPLLWHERSWTCPNSPVVGVCWYEADAFCRWLTMTCDDGYIYRLTDEREWEAAAAGFKARKYPWGEWAEDHCNTRETEIRKTTPVGIFPKGDTPEGISDLSGNIWEWTVSDYHGGQSRGDFVFDEKMQKLYDEQNWNTLGEALEEKDRQLPVLRGGSWDYGRFVVGCSFRNWYRPDSRLVNVGFRCVRTK